MYEHRTPTLLFVFLFYYFLHFLGGKVGHAMACLRRSEENLRDLALSLHHVGPGLNSSSLVASIHIHSVLPLSFLPIPELLTLLRWHLSTKLPFFCFCVPKLSVAPPSHSPSEMGWPESHWWCVRG